MSKTPFSNACDASHPAMARLGRMEMMTPVATRPMDTVPVLDDLAEADFRELADLIEQRCGIHLPPTKRPMMAGRLRSCARKAGAHSLHEYCRYLFDQGGLDRELPVVLDAVTTNKTDFFREPQHFTYLIDEIVPDLLAHDIRDLAVWSAACSTGPEAYTLAMVLDRAAQAHNFEYHVYASDISTEVLQKAERAVYPAEMVEPVPATYRGRYVMSSRNRSANLVRIVPELRRMVSFKHHNLLSTHSPWNRKMDVVFCRNVLIYFTRATQERVMQNICQQLRIGGYLFLGHSESTMTLSLPLEQIRPSIYRRIR